MLTLAESAQLGDFSVYRDVRFDGGVRGVSSRFYAIATAPRLARDAAGPAFRFIRYRELTASPGAATTLHAGGLITLVLDLQPTAAEQAALRARVAEHYQLASADAVELLDVPIKGGRARLSFGGDASGPDAFGAAQDVAIAGAARVCFAMPVSQDGAGLLANALDRGVAVLFASLAVELDYVLDGVSLHVWCDARRASVVASSLAAVGGPPSAGALAEQLISSRAAGIDVESAAPLPGDQAAKLVELGHGLLATALASTIVPPPAAGQPATVVASDTRTQLTLNHTFTMTYPATAGVTLDGPLPLQLTADERSASELDVDLGADRLLLEVTVVCPVDFAAGLVSTVHVSVAYDATTADGSPIHRDADVVLRDGAPRQVFRFDASPTQRSYAWRATVTYQDGGVFELPARTTDDTVLVVELGQLGVLALTVRLGDVPLAIVARAIVDLELPSRGLQHQMILDGGTPEATWQVVTGDQDPGACRYRVTWLLVDGRRLQEDAREAVGARLLLGVPRDLIASSTVTAIAVADFTDVAQLIVELRPGAAPDAEHAILKFTEAGKPQAWSFAAPGGAPLRYQARRTVIARDGTTSAFDYTDEDSPILLVRDVSRFAVQLIARLLDLGGAYALALVTLACDDAAPPVQDTLTIRDRTEQPIWQVRLATPDRHRYRVQVTLVARDGTRQIGNWADADEEIFVLRPPER